VKSTSKQETNLRNSLYTALFERVPLNIAIIDRDFQIVEANRNFTEAFGEWEGRLCYEIYKDRKSPCDSCRAEMVFTDGQARVSEERRLDRHGKHSYYVVHFEPIVREDGTVSYIIEMSQDVTETRLMRREYDIVFDRVPCYVSVLDQDKNIVRQNELFRKTFGSSLGKKCYEILQHKNEPCENCPAEQTFADSQIHGDSKKAWDKKGKPVYYQVFAAPLSRGGDRPSHVIEMALDITETRKLEEQLQQAFDFGECLIGSSFDGIIATDSEGKIIIFNSAAENLFKYKADEVVGKKIVDKFLPKEFLDVLDSKGSDSVLDETTVHDCNGEPILVRFSSVVLRSGDRTIGNAAFFHDLRKIKKLEKEKHEAETERLAAVGRTVAGIAHGIKNVLMGLEGGVYVVNTGMQKDDKEMINIGWSMLQGNLDRMTTYVRDFLDFAKGRVPNVSEVDPKRIAKDVIDLYKNTAYRAGVQLLADIDEGVANANLDQEGIHTCLANLISNAIDACEMSDGKDHKVLLGVHDQDGTLVFEVSDNGCGMDYDLKKNLFTTFFSTKESGKGTGLGLLITRKITQDHGGKVTVDSSEGKGSVFRMSLPRSRLPMVTEEQN